MIEGHDWVSKTVSGIAVSAIKGMAIRAAKMEDVASLTWGLPSFATPEPIRRAVARLLADGFAPQPLPAGRHQGFRSGAGPDRRAPYAAPVALRALGCDAQPGIPLDPSLLAKPAAFRL